MDFTKQYHLDTYASISCTQPELSQSGRTIFITGGAGGVGLAISRSFTEAGATRLVIVGRRAKKLAEAKNELLKLAPKPEDLEILTYPCDIADSTGSKAVWADLKSKGIEVDVLVLNAAIANTVPNGLDEDDFVDKVWATFDMNVRTNLELTSLFLKQGRTGKAVVSINSSAAHISPTQPIQLGYAPSKAALGALMQGIADSLKVEEAQIVSFHPGSVKSESVMKSRWANAPIAWNTDKLSGDFAVWASTKEARFLHGRFVWCNWDVDEMKAMGEFKHPGFSRIGLQGPKALSSNELWGQMEGLVKRQA
ncbi:uncharacterized protein N0V89_010450 [Didymosphaeria variabile]|uniref:NAD(P)-binding protein n=1 Tax=Didymosphaeria variabile TaxID=1932322 RepID=A0A9W9C665_9PLEO|nr:uncharacterized protein N0V89_010450 [Didymosphaeria variabile]KAJ4346519.1 hypothetical protein N0V89_010450 [Didymosphaeria variabile]